MRTGIHVRLVIAAAAVAASIAAQGEEGARMPAALAEAAPSAAALPGATPVSESTLEQVRGGFEIPANLHASLQLQRVVFANGEQIADLAVDIPDIAHMTVSQAESLGHAAGTLVIQAGPNNAFSLVELGVAATVIQNTLNDQHLVAVTTLNVEVNSLSAFREMAFQDGLRDGLGGVTGVR
jgi:hypothetical protein